MGCHEKHLTKGEDLISSLYPEKVLKHRVPGGQIVRPDRVCRHGCRFWIWICQGLQNVSDALTLVFNAHW